MGGQLNNVQAVVNEGEIPRNNQRTAHRHQFGPRIDAPPKPAQDKQAAGAGADEQQQVEGLPSIRQQQTEPAAEHQRNHGRQSARTHLLRIGGIRSNEAHPKVVDQVARTEVELGGHGAHEGGQQRCRDQAQESFRQQGEHGRVGQVVANFVRRNVGERRLQIRQRGEHHNRRQGDQNPRPRAQGVVRHIE